VPQGVPIEFDGLTKRFGAVEAVSRLTFAVQPGRVTGFLGPNGAGKTTSLRMLLGLVRPTEGTARIGGRRYRELDRPFETIGVALESTAFHPGRTARDHLRVQARAAGVAPARADAVLDRVGLHEYGGRKVGGYSMGMRQRLGLAQALLGEPGVVVFDEPINGLDPEGIRWIRGFLRDLAAEGRTVLISSHVLSEVQQSVDEVVVIAKGRLVHTGPLSSIGSGEAAVVVDAPDRGALAAALHAAGIAATPFDDGLRVTDADSARVGAVAQAAGVALSALVPARTQSLEEGFLELVGEGGSL